MNLSVCLIRNLFIDSVLHLPFIPHLNYSATSNIMILLHFLSVIPVNVFTFDASDIVGLNILQVRDGVIGAIILAFSQQVILFVGLQW